MLEQVELLIDRRMKRIVSIIVLAVVLIGPVSCKSPANKTKVEVGEVEKLVSKYTGKDGFEVTSFGGLAMGLMKMVANASATSSEDKDALSVLDGIRKFVVVEYEGADDRDKQAFRDETASLLHGAEKIMEVNDSGEKVEIYGTLSTDGQNIKDVIINIPEECSMICFFGKVNLKDLGMLTEVVNE